MALTKCFECGHEVSTSATACPHCGVPLAAASPSLPVTPPPPPPLPTQDGGVFGLTLHRIIQIGWICLGVGIFFTAAYEPAFLGVIIALVLGIVVFFRKQRRNGLILSVAALVTLIVILGFSLAHEILAPKEKHFSPKQKLVNELTISFRESLLDNTQVLRIRNPNPESVDFYLRCYARDGSSKTLFVSAPALETKEIGILEGWQFEAGERFDAVCDGAVIWHSEVK